MFDSTLIARLVDLRSLVEALPTPTYLDLPSARLSALDADWPAPGLGRTLELLGERVAVPGLRIRRSDVDAPTTLFEASLGHYLAPLLAELRTEMEGRSLEEVVSSTITAPMSFSERYHQRTVATGGGGLVTYASDAPRGDASAVVLVLPCGMPAPLLDPWMAFWAERHRVLTWETRGMFPANAPFDPERTSVEAQADDLFAVMDAHGVEVAHVMGSCGGAVIALAAAAREPARVSSLSLWHGSYHLDTPGTRTEHEKNLQALLSLARGDPGCAAMIRRMLCERPSVNLSSPMAPHVLYPYANDALTYRYAWLNSSLLETDVRPYLDVVEQPTLVVTSRADSTAHPEASRHVASRLALSTLHEEAEGDHLSHFEASASARALARRFVDSAGHPSQDPGNA